MSKTKQRTVKYPSKKGKLPRWKVRKAVKEVINARKELESKKGDR